MRRSQEFRWVDIDIGAEETRDDDHGGAFAVRHAQAVVHRGGVQEQEFGAEQRLLPNGKTGLSIMLANARQEAPV